MKFIKKFYRQIKEFCIAYPAVLSGYFIYSYLFFAIMRYYLKVKTFGAENLDIVAIIVDSFDAFPFMWLLSLALVKVIDIRTKFHKSEEQRLLVEREIQLQQTQLKTLQEVTRGVQHHINNPLAIISLSLGSARRAAKENSEVLHQLEVIDESVQRINNALSDFSKIKEYTVESAGHVVGNIASPTAKK